MPRSQPRPEELPGALPPVPSEHPSPSARSTKESLLDAAERLFAARGFEGTSLRAVTQAAGQSVSAAHYHFGGKRGLLRATLERRLRPVVEGRLRMLDALEARGTAPRVEEVLEAFLRPTFGGGAEAAGARARFVAARLFSDPPELVGPLIRELFGEVHRRFLDALEAALPPGTARREIELGFRMVVGATVQLLGAQPPREGTEPWPAVPEELVPRLVRFTAAGLRALAAAEQAR